MTATVVYDKTVFDVNSVGDEGRYKFTLEEDSAAEDGDGSSADEDEADADEDEDEGSMMKKDSP